MDNQKDTPLHPSELKHDEMENYLIQQGFFRDEVKVPTEHSPQMGDLFSCARHYLRDKRLNHGRNPMLYLEAIAFCILHRSFTDLDEPQKKAITNFAELLAERV